MTTHYGLIGCGMMGREHIQSIQLLDDTNVAVIYEPDAKMAASAAMLAPGATLVNSVDALLAHVPLDCIVIASPNHCHVGQLEEIAAKRALPILVEKPLFTEPGDLDRIMAFRDSYPAPVWVGMEYRYMPPMQQFLSEIESVVGNLKMLTLVEHRFPFLSKVDNWNRFNANTGGTFVEKCCHFFDLMRLIVKSDPVRVMATGGQEVNHLNEVFDGKPSDIWDCGYVIVDFANGARAMLELSMFAEGSAYQEMIHAIGSDGKIEVKLPGPARLWAGEPGEQPVPVLVKSPRKPFKPETLPCPIDDKILSAGDHNGSTYHQHARFLEVVRGKGAVEVTIDDGIWAVRMGQAAQESARTGMPVSL